MGALNIQTSVSVSGTYNSTPTDTSSYSVCRVAVSALPATMDGQKQIFLAIECSRDQVQWTAVWSTSVAYPNYKGPVSITVPSFTPDLYTRLKAVCGDPGSWNVSCVGSAQ